MSDRTTISVSEDTKAKLDDARDGTPWDEFLWSLVDSDGADVVELSPESVEDVANAVARKTADELEVRLQ